MSEQTVETKKTANSVQIYRTPGLTWVNVTSPSREALAEVKQRYPFLLDLDLRDCLPPYQRPKLLNRGQYLFMVLLFPEYNPDTGRLRAAELDLFVGKDFVITNHFNELKPLQELANCYDTADETWPAENLGEPASWIHNLLSQLLTGCFPMLTHIANDVEELECELQNGRNDQTLQNIIRVRSNVIDFRRTIQGHKRVYQKFIEQAPEILEFQGLDLHYDDLVGQTKEIWDFLDNDSITIDSIYQSYTSLISYETSEASKALAALALIILPTTLVAAIFTMDAEHMPIRGYIGDWWIQLVLVLTTAAMVIYFLKRKRWL